MAVLFTIKSWYNCLLEYIKNWKVKKLTKKIARAFLMIMVYLFGVSACMCLNLYNLYNYYFLARQVGADLLVLGFSLLDSVELF